MKIEDFFPGPPLEILGQVKMNKIQTPKNTSTGGLVFFGGLVISVVVITAIYKMMNDE